MQSQFGTKQAMATATGVSLSYFKKTEKRYFPRMGRIKHAQGKPAVLCTPEFFEKCVDACKSKFIGTIVNVYPVEPSQPSDSYRYDFVGVMRVAGGVQFVCARLSGAYYELTERTTVATDKL